MPKKVQVTFYLIAFAIFPLFSQEISIREIELDGDYVWIHYSLIDSIPGRNYAVLLYGSRDNFTSPLQKVKGDAGIEIKPGIQKYISWNAKEEFGNDFEGKVTFEIRAKVYVPFMTLTKFNVKKLKRESPYEITWTGGRPQNILNFDLVKGEKRIATFSNIPNLGHYTMIIPKRVKPGDGYQFKISDTKNKDEIIQSRPFAVSRKVPLLLKVLVPVVVLGVTGYLLWGNSNAHEDDIPYFPNPTGK